MPQNSSFSGSYGAGEVAHGLLDGFAVLNVEGIAVVLREQVECGFAGQAGVELCHGSS